MRYFSMFSGIGGFELGIERAYESNLTVPQREKFRWAKTHMPDDQQKQLGTQPFCVGYSEIDKYAIQIYEKHFKHKNYGDATKINEKELPDFELLVGGFPCQSFSIAGRRGGFNDTRGTLFFDICRIVKEKQPRLVLLENVKGLLSHDEGRTFRTIISTLDELGYDVQWQVLNSKDFGVPQNRERVFIVGHLRGTSRPQVFPFTESSGQNIKQIIGGSQGNRVYDPTGISVTLASQAGGLGAKTGLYISRVNRKEKIYDLKETEIAGTLTATMYKGIDASGRTGVIDGYKIRRLTPIECERLQAYPDGWTEGLSDTQRYKTLGNGVTVNVVEAVVTRLLRGGGK